MNHAAPRPALISVDEGFAALSALIAPVGLESVCLADAVGRVLRRPCAAVLRQPPLDVSSMDGYAVRAEDARPGATLRIGAWIPAGAAPGARVAAGEAARVFTGAAVPAGADLIVLQEDVDTLDEHRARIATRFDATSPDAAPGAWIRRAGQDFDAGETLLEPPRRLSPADIALAAAGGAAWLDVARRPRVRVLALGDELRRPGEPTKPGEIAASNQYGVAALVAEAGGVAESPPIVPDDEAALCAALEDAAGADVVVTLGGASDGAHDLARPAFEALGAELAFSRIALRPGKPLTIGRLGRALIMGLPGNPVSAMVCARLFLQPALDALQGLALAPPRPRMLPLAAALSDRNGPRAHYMRASIEVGPHGPCVRPFERQDSALLSVLSQADALAVRPPNDPPKAVGDLIPVLSPIWRGTGERAGA